MPESTLIRFFQRRNIHYGWVLVAVSFITMFVSLGFRFAFGVYYVAILEEMGWQRAETAGIFSIAMISYALFCLLSGILFDWLGPRVIFPCGCLLLGVGMLLSSTITSIWQFYLWYGLLVGISYSMVGFITHMAYIPRWFVKRRALAMSIALSGIGVGALVISIVSEQLLLWIGWRTTFALLGIAAIVVLAPFTFIFHRNSPQEVGLAPYGGEASGGERQQTQVEDIGLGKALRQPTYWMLFVTVFCIGASNMSMVVHQTPLLVDMGYSLTLAAALLGITGLLRSLGGIIWGPVSEWIGRIPCIWTSSTCGVLSLVLLQAMGGENDYPLLWGFTLLWGIGFLGITPIYAATVADRFQGRHLGKIIGMLDQGFGLGAASGPYFAGVIFDLHHNYDLMIKLLAGIAVLMGLTLWLANLNRSAAH